MKKFYFLLIGAILFSTFLKAQTSDEIEIRKIVSDQEKSWNRGDLDGFMKDVHRSDTSHNFIGMPGSPTIKGWRATLDTLRKFHPDPASMGKLSIDISRVKVMTPDFASVGARWQLKKGSSNQSGMYVLLLRKINEKWMIGGISMENKR